MFKPGFRAEDERGQLARVANKNELLRSEQRSERRRKQNLRRLVDDAHVEDAMTQHDVIRAETGGCHDALRLEKHTFRMEKIRILFFYQVIFKAYVVVVGLFQFLGSLATFYPFLCEVWPDFTMHSILATQTHEVDFQLRGRIQNLCVELH